ncbi:hypothetical protein AB0I39_06635 [Kitasatospora purpeofusca]|uniref:hypothetical protein n=1 Tax=Kitasatospora purpeofusca TaxID=67352 RepID=UPI0034004616
MSPSTIARRLAALALPFALACAATSATAAGTTAPADSALSASSGDYQVDFSTTSAEPGEAVEVTVTLDKPAYRQGTTALWLTADGGSMPFSRTDCTSEGPGLSNCRLGKGSEIAGWYSLRGAFHSVLHFRTTVPEDAAPGTRTLTLTALSGGAEQTFSPESFAFTVLPATPADVVVGLKASSTPLALGTGIDYVQSTRNLGPAPLARATVITDLPAEVTSVTGLPDDCLYDGETRQVACDSGALSAGGAVEHSFRAHLGPLAPASTLTATATRTGSAPVDPDPANDTATATCTALTSALVTC